MDPRVLYKLVLLHDSISRANLDFGEAIDEVPAVKDQEQLALVRNDYAEVLRELDEIMGGCPDKDDTPGMHARITADLDPRD